jgi:hypothetical protein
MTIHPIQPPSREDEPHPRVVWLTPASGHGIQRDTFQDRVRPALERMARAQAWVQAMRLSCRTPKVCAYQDGTTKIIDRRGQPLTHPVGCLPELLWVLRDDPAYPFGNVGPWNWANREGGAA